ncbi:MAG: phosphotransferase [Candidatus Zixiibacteriota bacterium]
MRRSGRCRSGSHHATFRVTTDQGAFAVRIGPADMEFGDWERHARLAACRTAPRLLCQGYREADNRVFGYEIWEWLDGRRFDYNRDLRPLAATLATLHRRTRHLKIAARETTDLRTYLRHHLQWYLDNTTVGPITRLRGQRRAWRRVPTPGAAVGCGHPTAPRKSCKTGWSQVGDPAESLHRAATASLALLEAQPPFDRRFDCLVHNDLVPGNIIVTSEGARLIDWDWAICSHPALDLCGVMSPFVTSWEGELALQHEQVAAFLERYLQPFSRAESRIIMRGLLDAWQAFNTIVANWTYRNADPARPHFRDPAFYRRSFAHAAGMWAFMRAEMAT